MTSRMQTWQKRRLRLSLASNQDWRCVYCFRTLSFDPKDYRKACHATLDHLHPRAKGGKSKLDNLVLCCRLCNIVKGNVTLEEFIFGLLWIWLYKERPLMAFALVNYLNTNQPKASVPMSDEPLDPLSENELVTKARLDIHDSRIHYRLYQQDGTMQAMDCADTPSNRMCVSWFQAHDRYTATERTPA